MKNTTKEKVFPFEYSGWDEDGGDYGDICFHDVTFTEDFGPIKNGDTFDSVYILHCQGVLVCYNVMKSDVLYGVRLVKEIHKIQFKAVPIE